MFLKYHFFKLSLFVATLLAWHGSFATAYDTVLPEDDSGPSYTTTEADSDAGSTRPKLTVLFFVDQARFNQPLDGKYPEFQGFKRHQGGAYSKFYDKGVVFDYSEYQHAATYTTQGWGTVVTGGNPHYNRLPHAIYYEYDKLGHIAKFNPMDGIKTNQNIDYYPAGNSGGNAFDFKVPERGKITAIQVRKSAPAEAYISLRFKYQDSQGTTQYSASYGTRWNDNGTGWTEIAADTISKVIYYSKNNLYIDRLDFFDAADNLIATFGDSTLKNGSVHEIKGNIIGAKGRSGWWVNHLAFTTDNQWPGAWSQPGDIKTISDSFATQFPDSKVFAVGGWSYPVGMISGKQGKGFWLGDALNGWNAEGIFESSTYIYPDTNNDGKPDIPSWMSSYNTQGGTPVKRVLDGLTALSGNPWNITKCNVGTHNSSPCWTWDTLYTRNHNNYVNYPYDDDNRGDGIKYEFSKNACAVWARSGRALTFPYQVGVQPAGVTCPVTINGDSASGWQQNANQNLLYGSYATNVITDAAKHIISSQNLGKDDTPDLLIVYTSTLDMVGHVFGPDSMEYEDTFYRIDKALGELMDWIDNEVGQDNVFYALTGDHGMDSTPEYLATNPQHLQKFYNEKQINAGRLMVADIKTAINQSIIVTLKRLTGRLNLPSSNPDYVVDIVTPTVYLDLNKIRLAMCDNGNVSASLHSRVPNVTAADKQHFETNFCNGNQGTSTLSTQLIDSIYMKYVIDQAVAGVNLPEGALAAYSYNTIQSGGANAIQHIPENALGRLDDQTNHLATLVGNMYVHGRSGQIYVVPKPHYYYYHSEGYSAMHSTPYWYDRYTQLMYLGERTQYLPDDLRHVRNLAYAEGLGDNAYKVQQAGIKTQQHNIVATLGHIMGIGYDNMPKTYRNRIGSSSGYHSAYRVLTHLYQDEDYMKIRLPYNDTCLAYSPSGGLTGGQCDNSEDTAWHYDFKNKQLKSKHNVCLKVGSLRSGSRVATANCDSSQANQRLELLAHMNKDSADKMFLLHPVGSRLCVTNWGGIKVYNCVAKYDGLQFEAHADSTENRSMTHGPIDLVFTVKYGLDDDRRCLFVEDGVPTDSIFADECYKHGDVWHLDRGMLKHVATGQCVDADASVDQYGESGYLTMVDCAHLASVSGAVEI